MAEILFPAHLSCGMRFRPTGPGLGRGGFLSRAWGWRGGGPGTPLVPITEREIRAVSVETNRAATIFLSPTWKDFGVGLVDYSVLCGRKRFKEPGSHQVCSEHHHGASSPPCGGSSYRQGNSTESFVRPSRGGQTGCHQPSRPAVITLAPDF